MTYFRPFAVGAALVLAATTLVPAAASVPDGTVRTHTISWRDVGTGTGEQYRGLDAVNRRVAWVAGEDGGVLRTTDGGRTWQDVAPPRFSAYAFRDVEARGPRIATILAIGPGEESRIYRTHDGGRTWAKTFVNHAPNAFYNCMDFWAGGRYGLVVSDPVQGKFRILRTTDGGASWSVVPPHGMPPAVDGEFNFAASGTCLVTVGKRRAYMASGGAAARIFRTGDRGRTWRVTEAPLPAAEAGGVFSLAFRSVQHGVAVGGDFTAAETRSVTGRTRSAGRQWETAGRTHGYRSGVDYRARRPRVLVAVGPSGTDVSHSGGRRWVLVDRTPYDSVDCAWDGSCWASGPDGGVAKLRWR